MSDVLTSSFPHLSSLPEDLPLFPLLGVVLLPGARLPLNIFEPRYLSMVDYALGQPGRLIGMVQPNMSEPMDSFVPPLYKTGCAGRILSFTETEDGRYLIGLTGVSRFVITEEVLSDLPYRSAKVDWNTYRDDVNATDEIEIDRKHLMEVIEGYFKMQGIAADWGAVQSTPNDMLISSLVMICPLPPNEKQALLEAPNLRERANLLTALLEMASLPRQESEGGARH